MTEPTKPPTRRAPNPFKFRVVGHASRLPEPCRISVPAPGDYDLDILTTEEWKALGPGDCPEEFRPLRLGLMGRIRTDESGGPVGPKPSWMD